MLLKGQSAADYYKNRWFDKCWKEFREAVHGQRFVLREEDQWRCLDDNTGSTGFDPHYLYHPAWAARCVRKINPAKHIDISSKLDFVTITSAFVPVEFYDFRPADVHLDGLACRAADLNALPFADNSVESLSCMHVVEHIGLGRYGDAIDYDGDLKAIAELKRVVAPGGSLLFVVPMGREAKIQYNAHRIYTYDMVKELFDDMEIVEFAFIRYQNHGEETFYPQADRAVTLTEDYGCGCFWFRKK